MEADKGTIGARRARRWGEMNSGQCKKTTFSATPVVADLQEVQCLKDVLVNILSEKGDLLIKISVLKLACALIQMLSHHASGV